MFRYLFGVQSAAPLYTYVSVSDMFINLLERVKLPIDVDGFKKIDAEIDIWKLFKIRK